MKAIDLDQLADRATAAAQAWAPGCAIRDLVPMEGGTISLVYSGAVDGGVDGHDTVVLKVAPPGLPPVRNRDVLRQGRCMAALGGRPGVAVPPVLFTDAGDPDDVPPFVATGLVAGECIEPLLAARESPMAHDEVRDRSFAAARMLASLHRVVPAEIGLGDEPVTSPADEVARWTRTLDTVPDAFRAGYEDCADALTRSAPELSGPVVVHGDYRLGNMLASAGAVGAIIDWEIWSISDPRIDLSWFLFFTEEAEHPVVTPGMDSGVPHADELLAAYESAAGTEVEDLWWFEAMTRYKEAAAMALIAKHMLRNDPEGDAGRAMAEVCPRLIADASRRLRDVSA